MKFKSQLTVNQQCRFSTVSRKTICDIMHDAARKFISGQASGTKNNLSCGRMHGG